MKARVFMMVDTGEGAPVSRGTAWRHGGWGEWNLSTYARYWQEQARRWWLVEAESAFAARRVIEWSKATGFDSPPNGIDGRILASGGKVSETDNATAYHREDGSK